jgi:hypothetical protein
LIWREEGLEAVTADCLIMSMIARMFSSFMSTAIGKVFFTALSGKCDKKPELAQEKLGLELEIAMLPCYGGKRLIDRIFIPLGYETEYSTHVLDDKFTEWGESKYVNLKLKGKVQLSELLNHLYIPIACI